VLCLRRWRPGGKFCKEEELLPGHITVSITSFYDIAKYVHMCACDYGKGGEQHFYIFMAYYKFIPTIFHERIRLHKFCTYPFQWMCQMRNVGYICMSYLCKNSHYSLHYLENAFCNRIISRPPCLLDLKHVIFFVRHLKGCVHYNNHQGFKIIWRKAFGMSFPQFQQNLIMQWAYLFNMTPVCEPKEGVVFDYCLQFQRKIFLAWIWCVKANH